MGSGEEMTYLRVHVNETVCAPGGEGRSTHHMAVMEMVVILQATNLRAKNKKNMKAKPLQVCLHLHQEMLVSSSLDLKGLVPPQ